MLGKFSRTELLLGAAGMERLGKSCVAVFGIGGVGSFVAEALVRSGVGHLVLIDDDRVCETNINRQLHATTKTVGRLKSEVMRERLLEINPAAVVDVIADFYLPEKAQEFFCFPYDYIVDAIDTVTGKIDLVLQAQQRGIPIISSMGAGNKLHPELFEVADIYETSVCPLARVMRRELRQRGVKSLQVVYSREKPLMPGNQGCGSECICPPGSPRTCAQRRSVPGSISFVPSAAGLIAAGVVVRGLSTDVLSGSHK